MASSNSTQKTDKQIVDEKLKSKKIAAMVQTKNEVTPVPTDKEQAFRDYVKEWKIADLDNPNSHYDYRGAFAAGTKPELGQDGKFHWPDTFKQHGHPTFSVESQYSTGPEDGGHWIGERFVPAGEEANPPAPTTTQSPNAGASLKKYIAHGDPENFARNINAGKSLRQYLPKQLSDTILDSITQKPSERITLLPGTGHDVQMGKFAGVISDAAIQLKDALIGAGNFLGQGPVGPDLPVVTESQAEIAKSQGLRHTVQTQKDIDQTRTAAAFLGSSLVGGMATGTVLKEMAPFYKHMLSGTAAGATFGALRPHGKDESILWSIAGDALMFGGLGMAAGLIGKFSTPLKVGSDQLELGLGLPPVVQSAGGRVAFVAPEKGGISLFADAAHVTTKAGAKAGEYTVHDATGAKVADITATLTDPKTLKIEGIEKTKLLGTPETQRVIGGLLKDYPGVTKVKSGDFTGIVAEHVIPSPAEYGKAIFEEVNNIASYLTGGDLSEVGAQTLLGLDMKVMDNPANISWLRRFFGSPSKWFKIGGPVGDAAGRITENAGQRAGVARRLMDEWKTTLAEAEDLLSTIKGGDKMPVLKDQLGKLLDTVFQPGDLPEALHPSMAKAFEIIRNRLLADREALRLLVGGVEDWGIDAYFAHVFTGGRALYDAANPEKIIAIGNMAKIKEAALKFKQQNPDMQFISKPLDWEIPSDMAGLGLTGSQLGRFASVGSQILGLDPGEFVQVMFNNKLVRMKPGKKFFGNVLERGDKPLEGWETDPFKALAIYSTGVARKLAFHDFEQKSGKVLESLAKVNGTRSSVEALQVYIDRVLGRASESEIALRATLQDWAKRATKPFGTGVQDVAEMYSDPRVLLGKVTQLTAMAKLGYSPISWFVNVSQTLVNTSSAIGWNPTMRGLRLYMDTSQRPQVEAILRSLGVDLSIPLTAADQIVTRNVGQVSGFHPLYLFNKAETANRAIAGLAAYQDAILKGASIEDAIPIAQRFIRDTQFDYSMADTPRLMQGPLGSTMFQFKKFLIKELEFMWGLRNNPAALARFTVNIQAVGGVTALMQLPPGILADYIAGYTTGETITERVQRAYPRLSRGLPGLLDIDVSGSVAIGLPKDAGDVIGPGVTDIFALAKDAIVKPGLSLSGDILAKLGVGTTRIDIPLSPKEKGELIAQVTPVVVRRLMDSYDILQHEVVQKRSGTPTLVRDAKSGKLFQDAGSFLKGEGWPTNPGATAPLIFTPEDPHKEAALTLFGFRSLDRAEVERARQTSLRQVEQGRADEQKIVQAWADAKLNDDDEEARTILSNASEHGFVLSREQLRAAMIKASLEQTKLGALRAPPEMRANQLRQLPDFLMNR